MSRQSDRCSVLWIISTYDIALSSCRCPSTQPRAEREPIDEASPEPAHNIAPFEQARPSTPRTGPQPVLPSSPTDCDLTYEYGDPMPTCEVPQTPRMPDVYYSGMEVVPSDTPQPSDSSLYEYYQGTGDAGDEHKADFYITNPNQASSRSVRDVQMTALHAPDMKRVNVGGV
jgi:hypothetical protein